MLGRKNKWNQIFGRDLLYAQLTERFGPYNEWGNRNYPDKRRDEYFQFIKDFSIAMSILSNDETSENAVHQQIAWALTDQETIGGSHTSQYILNQASAYRARFLMDKDFPSLVLSERK
jgi:hypothetical protein